MLHMNFQQLWCNILTSHSCGVSRTNNHKGSGCTNHKGRDSIVPLPAGTGAREGAIREAHSGRVPEVDRADEGSGEGRDGQKEGERRRGG